MPYIKIKLEDMKKYNCAETLILSLVRSFNVQNKIFQMKQETLANMLNVSLRKITYAINTLTDNKELVSVRRFKKSSVLQCHDVNTDNAHIRFDISIFNYDIKVQDMVVLAFLKNNYPAKDITKFIPKSTVYDSIKRLKDKNLYVEVKKEKKKENKQEILSELSNNLSNNAKTTAYIDDNNDNSSNDYCKPKNKFNNFKQRQYSKEEWEETNKLFFA